MMTMHEVSIATQQNRIDIYPRRDNTGGVVDVCVNVLWRICFYNISIMIQK